MTRPLDDILKEAVSLRHEIHRHPELSWEEEKTADLIRQRLDQLGIPWRSCAKNGTVAMLAPMAKGKHIALRCDIDALPMQEEAKVDYRSEVAGCMHACGHDGHTAVLWSVAAAFKQNEAQLPGPVSLIFQPAEEGGHGAREMINAGALIGVDEIYGWHNWPAIPKGQAVCPDGPIMCGNGTFEIVVVGKGGHSSQPELCRDPILAASAIVMNLQQIVSRRLPPQEAAVVSLTSFDGKSGDTIIPESVTLSGSIRFGHIHLRDVINDHIQSISEATAIAHDVEAHVTIKPRYDTTVNHAGAAKHFRHCLEHELGKDWSMKTLRLPVMASEDFSYYLKEIPGAYALIGTAEGRRFAHPCHSPHYEFNDGIIPSVFRTLSRLVGLTHLSSKEGH